MSQGNIFTISKCKECGREFVVNYLLPPTDYCKGCKQEK